MKKIFVTLLALLSFVAVNAQEDLKTPYWFLNVRGGVSMPLESDLSKIIYTAPTGTVSVGRMLNPIIGARLNVNRDFATAEQRAMATPEPTVCFDKLTVDIDAMFNLCTIFGKKDYYPLNVYMLAGLGTDHLGGGFMAEYSICRNLGIMAETTLNSHKVWKAQAGLCYHFGHSKPKPTPVAAAAVQSFVETAAQETAPAKPVVQAPKPEPKPEPKPVEVVELNEAIFYAISQSDVEDDAVINKVVAWCNKYQDKQIVVSGYADKGTGNANVNRRIAEARATKVADAIKAKGVSADRITVQSFGDTVQPYAENDKNRVTIIVGRK